MEVELRHRAPRARTGSCAATHGTSARMSRKHVSANCNYYLPNAIRHSSSHDIFVRQLHALVSKSNSARAKPCMAMAHAQHASLLLYLAFFVWAGLQTKSLAPSLLITLATKPPDGEMATLLTE